MLQMRILKEDTRSLFVPVAVKKIVINCEKHFSILHNLDKLNPGKNEGLLKILQPIDHIQK